MRNLINAKRAVPKNASLAEKINESYLIDKFDPVSSIKLRPVKNDRVALGKLFEKGEEDFDHSSALTRNYEFFCKAILGSGVPVDRLYEALSKLEIISITLGRDDNAQLIFESLNSTGLALAEGDKIRNYVLMGLSPEEQPRLYNEYWLKIEECCTKGNFADVSAFVRDYLSIKQKAAPTASRVYPEFKTYAVTCGLDTEQLLQELLNYARLYKRLLDCQCSFEDKKFGKQMDACLRRLERIEISLTRPFMLEVLRLVQGGNLSEADALKIFLTIESYIFRRYICDIPINSLAKVFAALNREILQYDGTVNDYLAKFNYALRARKEGGRFPDDDEFRKAFEHKDIFHMRANYRGYIFERFENCGEKAPNDVFKHLDEKEYSVEHIMPQTLTDEWRDALGADAEIIHQEWCHRLANLTLTAYNSELSNKPFLEKRDSPKYGYKASGIKINMKIAQNDVWGKAELQERNDALLDRAMEIWELPTTDFKPAVKEISSCTLDEDIDLTFANIAKYSLMGNEQKVKNWAEMFEQIVKELHSNDSSVLTALAYSNADNQPDNCVSNNPESLRQPLQIDEHIYFEKNTSTTAKIAILRKLFKRYGKEPEDLVFYLKKGKNQESDEDSLHRKYWEFALPKIREQNKEQGTFNKVNAQASRFVSGHFGMSDFSIVCWALSNGARVQSRFEKTDTAENKAAFDKLFALKAEIEEELGVALEWERNDSQKCSVIGLSLNDVNVGNEADWERMAEFHGEWSRRLLEAILPRLKQKDTARLKELAEIFKTWTLRAKGVVAHPEKSSTTCTRFTTAEMSALLPDLDAPSGWNTPNHYFYEIVNRSCESVHITFVLNSENITGEFSALCERINELYPAKLQKQAWVWRTHFRTSTFTFGEELSTEEIFAGLDALFTEIRSFEAELSQKLRA